MAQNLHCVFHGTGKAGQGNSLGLACLGNVGRLWATGTASHCGHLALGNLALGDLAQGKYWLRV